MALQRMQGSPCRGGPDHRCSMGLGFRVQGHLPRAPAAHLDNVIGATLPASEAESWPWQGSWYTIGGQQVAQGREKTLAYLAENPDISE